MPPANPASPFVDWAFDKSAVFWILRHHRRDVARQIRSQHNGREREGQENGGDVLEIAIRIDISKLIHEDARFGNSLLQDLGVSHAKITDLMPKLLVSKFFASRYRLFPSRNIDLRITFDNYWPPIRSISASNIKRGQMVIAGTIHKLVFSSSYFVADAEKSLSASCETKIQVVKVLPRKLGRQADVGESTSYLGHTVLLILFGTLVNRFQAGDRITAIGLLDINPPKHLSAVLPANIKNSKSYWFSVNNMQVTVFDPPTPTPQLLPNSSLVDDGEDWALTSYLIDIAANQVVPKAKYRKLILILLLSLLSRGQDALHVLLVSDDMLALRAWRFLSTLAADVTRLARIPSKKNFLDIKDRLVVFRVLDPLKIREYDLLEEVCKRRNSVVWLAIDPEVYCKDKKGRLVDMFDLVIRVDDKSDNENDKKTAEYILDMGSQSGHESQASAQARFSAGDIASRRKLQVHVIDNVRQLIKRYFMATRSRLEYPFSGLECIARVSRCHAKLHARKFVNMTDVLVGIMIVEESRSHHTSQTAMSFRDLRDGNLNIDKHYAPSAAMKLSRRLLGVAPKKKESAYVQYNTVHLQRFNRFVEDVRRFLNAF